MGTSSANVIITYSPPSDLGSGQAAAAYPRQSPDKPHDALQELQERQMPGLAFTSTPLCTFSDASGRAVVRYLCRLPAVIEHAPPDLAPSIFFVFFILMKAPMRAYTINHSTLCFWPFLLSTGNLTLCPGITGDLAHSRRVSQMVTQQVVALLELCVHLHQALTDHLGIRRTYCPQKTQRPQLVSIKHASALNQSPIS